jgi:hypothetical protein
LFAFVVLQTYDSLRKTGISTSGAKAKRITMDNEWYTYRTSLVRPIHSDKSTIGEYWDSSVGPTIGFTPLSLGIRVAQQEREIENSTTNEEEYAKQVRDATMRPRVPYGERKRKMATLSRRMNSWYLVSEKTTSSANNVVKRTNFRH